MNEIYYPENEELRIQRLKNRVAQRFSVDIETIRVVRAPLRICPLGAHIDHQLGQVTGMTIDRALLLAFAPTDAGQVVVESSGFDAPTAFDLAAIPAYQTGDWGNYLRGAVLALQQTCDLTQGLVGMVDGEMPVGGLSSSAAVTIAYLLALEAIHGLPVSAHENIGLVSRTEQGYIGLRNGILDQTSILFSQPNHLTHIDCKDEAIQLLAAPESADEFGILVIYSGVQSSSLVGTGYNNRVAECQEAAQRLLNYGGQDVQGARLRDVNAELFETEGHRLPMPLRRRASHYFGEMARVDQGLAAWSAGDIARFGALISASGESSVTQYECGCPQMITLYDILRSMSGVYGTRFSGAGFRGNSIALIDPARREEIAEAVHRHYPTAHPDIKDDYSIHYCQSAGPAQMVDE